LELGGFFLEVVAGVFVVAVVVCAVLDAVLFVVVLFWEDFLVLHGLD